MKIEEGKELKNKIKDQIKNERSRNNENNNGYVNRFKKEEKDKLKLNIPELYLG